MYIWNAHRGPVQCQLAELAISRSLHSVVGIGLGLSYCLELESLSDLVQQGVSSGVSGRHFGDWVHLLQLGSSSDLVQQR